jgi:hypothetical protein
VESDQDDSPVHRLASDVLAHALLPTAAAEADPAEAQKAAIKALADVDSAMKLIIEFFTAATYGYMRVTGATRRTIG